MSDLTIAMELMEAGDMKGAREAYERAIASGEGGGAKLMLLDVLERLEDDAALLALADDLDGKGPIPESGRVVVVHSAAIAIYRARALMRAKRYDDAAAAARDAVQRLADNGGVVAGPVAIKPCDAYHVLGCALLKGGDPAASVDAFRAAVDLEPTWPSLRHTLGVALRAIGDFAGAAQEDRRAAELEPKDGDHFYNLACDLALLGNPNEALAALASAIAIDPANAAIACGDADLRSLANDVRFAELVRGR